MAPSLSQASLKLEFQFIKEWVPWTHWYHSYSLFLARSEKCHPPQSCKLHWPCLDSCPGLLLQLGSCTNILPNSVGVYSLIMNVSCTGDCSAGWGCCCSVFAFLFWRAGQKAECWIHFIVSLHYIFLVLGILPLNVPIKMSHTLGP